MNNVKDLAEFVFDTLGTTRRVSPWGDVEFQLNCHSEDHLEEAINAYLKKTGSVLFKAMQISEFNDDKYS